MVSRLAQRRQLRERARSWPVEMEPVPKAEWPPAPPGARVDGVWRSREFVAVLYEEKGGALRLSVNRVELRRNGEWSDRITWEELQRVKHETGYGNAWAVEVYPPDACVVNVANMRHLWLLESAPRFGWNRAG